MVGSGVFRLFHFPLATLSPFSPCGECPAQNPSRLRVRVVWRMIDGVGFYDNFETPTISLHPELRGFKLLGTLVHELVHHLSSLLPTMLEKRVDWVVDYLDNGEMVAYEF